MMISSVDHRGLVFENRGRVDCGILDLKSEENESSEDETSQMKHLLLEMNPGKDRLR